VTKCFLESSNRPGVVSGLPLHGHVEASAILRGAQQVAWVPTNELAGLMDEACAVRLAVELQSGTPKVRSHDGRNPELLTW